MDGSGSAALLQGLPIMLGHIGVGHRPDVPIRGRSELARSTSPTEAVPDRRAMFRSVFSLLKHEDGIDRHGGGTGWS